MSVVALAASRAPSRPLSRAPDRLTKAHTVELHIRRAPRSLASTEV